MELYLHIPFCAQKCAYCDFASYAGQARWMGRYVDCLTAEMAARPSNEPIASVFIGGGTPSLLPPELMARLLAAVRRLYVLAPEAEITCESNPGTLTADFVAALREGGVNRLSMGMQAAQPRLLRTLGRIHTMAEVEHSVALWRSGGTPDFNLDLMFGLPGQTETDWLETLRAALALSPTHLSCYGLIVEEGTPIAGQIARGELTLPDEEVERRMYDTALNVLAVHGFEHYEISNFALPDMACRHNLGYWRQDPYIGVGAAASSMARLPGFDTTRRTTNPSGLLDYMEGIEKRDLALAEDVILSPKDNQFEDVMLSLRLMAGVRRADFAARHGIALDQLYGEKLQAFCRQGLLEDTGEAVRLTRRGMDVQNAILVELMD